MSNCASAYGRASASPVSQASSRLSASARRRPMSSSAGVRSEAVTAAPVRAAGIATLPDPAATSSTSSPAPIVAASTMIGPRAAMISVATAS